jgi:hypothetical protein
VNVGGCSDSRHTDRADGQQPAISKRVVLRMSPPLQSCEEVLRVGP